MIGHFTISGSALRRNLKNLMSGLELQRAYYLVMGCGKENPKSCLSALQFVFRKLVYVITTASVAENFFTSSPQKVRAVYRPLGLTIFRAPCPLRPKRDLPPELRRAPTLIRLSRTFY
jgi:hypothetical protein